MDDQAIKDKRELVTVSFEGSRFDDHALDIDALPELIIYKKLLIQTAIEVWRQRNPSKRRLPKGFRDSLVIKFYELQEGSTVIPLVRELDLLDAPPLPLEDDELDIAAQILDRTLLAAAKGEAAPEDLPSSVLPTLAEFGKTLREDEAIGVRSRKANEPALLNRTAMVQIEGWANPTYTKEVVLIGEVRGTSIDQSSFRLKLEDGKRIPGKYPVSEERTILEALNEHDTVRVRIRGIAEYYSKDDALKRFANVEEITIVQIEDKQVQIADERPIWEVLSEIGASVPEHEWANLPTDFSKNIDHYLYGKAKE